MHQLRGGEHLIKYKIFIYSIDETWEDVLKDLLEDSNFLFGKADTVRLPDLIDRALISKSNCLSDKTENVFFMKIEFDFCCSLCCIKFDSLMSYIPLCSCEKPVWKYKAFKCKKKKFPTYPPADSVGRQCQTSKQYFKGGQSQRDLDCMYSNRSLEFYRIHIWFTSPLG